MELIEVRCPFKYMAKHDKNMYTCNRVCVKVYPGSSGEAKCVPCKKMFDFKVTDGDYTTSIRAKQSDEKQ